MSLKLFSLFTILAVMIAVPAVYPVQCPECHGTGVVNLSVVGMENIRLVDLSTLVVGTVRLGCGTYAVYTTNLTFTFSNVATVPINASVLLNTSYSETGSLISKTFYTFVVPANASNFVAHAQYPAQVAINNVPVLPTLSFSAAVFQASNTTVTLPCPKCHGKGTISLLQLMMGGG